MGLVLDLEPDSAKLYAPGPVAVEVPAMEALYRRVIGLPGFDMPILIAHDGSAADAANTPEMRAQLAEQQNSPSAMATAGPEVTFGVSSRDVVIVGVLLLGFMMLRRKKLV